MTDLDLDIAVVLLLTRVDSVGQQGGDENCKSHIVMSYFSLMYPLAMHAVFVEVVEEVCFLRLVNTGQHVLGIQKRPDDTLQLDSTPHIYTEQR